MKYFPSQILFLLQSGRTRRNIRSLAEFLLLLSLFITAYSLLFHLIMRLEGRDYSMITGFYWTLTVMSTLGFGDITFESDLGKGFSIFVLLTGIIFLLIMLPFAFIQFFYAPWLEAQSRSRAPRQLPEDVANHVIITGYDPISIALVENGIRENTGCSVIAIHRGGSMQSNPDPSETLRIDDEIIMIGTAESEKKFVAMYPRETWAGTGSALTILP
jgi:uncharacterized transporter YbjL